MRTRTRSGLAVVVVLSLASIDPGIASGQAPTNPQPTGAGYMTRHTNKGGVTSNYTGSKVCGPSVANPSQGHWIPQLAPWNGRNTTKPSPIDNVDTTGVAFGFTMTIPDGLMPPGTETVTVTAATSDAAWENAVYKAALGYTKVSGSTFDQNCYGYASGKGYWINEPGFLVLMQDEYKIETTHLCKAGGILKPGGQDHCIKLEECCPKALSGTIDTVKKTSEKNASSGVYSKTYDCATGGGTIYGTIYYK